MSKNISEINKKIKNKTVCIVRADEMTRIVREIGPERAAEKVDVVTTGTFGAMCSSGVFFNFGHSDPPIRMSKVWMNDVEAYGGIAAVDTYLGATQASDSQGIKYGGAHVIEDLLKGKSIVLKGNSAGTDCYPRKELLTEIKLKELNQAVLCNPRNAYQRYNAATNSTGETKQTYMGKLLPKCTNISFSGAGELSPLINDPEFKTIGIGTRIFLGGAQGYIIGSGTQHDPENGFATLMVQGNLKEMRTEYLRAASFPGYGCSLYVGIGIPIPVLNADVAKSTAIGDEEIFTNLLDYGNPFREKPVLKKINYAELKSGLVELNGKRVSSSSLSSFKIARNIAELLKKWMKNGQFFLSNPVEQLNREGRATPMPQKGSQTENRENNRFSNPEKATAFWEKERCIHCGFCLALCPEEVFKREENGLIQADENKCVSCGLCADICPMDSIHIS